MRDEAEDCVCWEEPLTTALRLLSRRIATSRQIQAALRVRQAERPKIGALALEQGKLTVPQVFEILRRQAMTGEYFGRIAVRLGYLDEASLRELLWLQVERSRTLADILEEQGVITPRQKADLTRRSRERSRRGAEMAIAE